ncbi:MAG: PAS domain S-box protein [Actinomycetota bacterium]
MKSCLIRLGKHFQFVYNLHFWSVITIILLITAYYYNEQIRNNDLVPFELFISLAGNFINHVLYLIPIIYASLAFNSKTGLLVLLTILIALLPKWVFLSTTMGELLLVLFAIVIPGVVVIVWTDVQKRQREKLERSKENLEFAQQEIKFKDEITVEQERWITTITSFSEMVNQYQGVSRVFELAVNMVKEVMQVEVVMLFILDKYTRELRITAFEGVNQNYISAVGKVKLGEGICGRVAETGQTIVAGSSSIGPDALDMGSGEEDFRTQISVPLRTRGRIIGTLCAATRMERQFSHEEVRMLTVIGNLIGIAIENSRLNEERETAAKKLKVSENRYRQLFENAHDAIWVQDLSDRIIRVNKAAAKLFGYPLSELIGKSFKDFFKPVGKDLSSEVQDKLLHGQQVSQPYMQKLIRKDGSEIILTLSANLILNNDQPEGFQFIGRDRTKEVRMQENQSFYLQQITKAHEEERLRISRDLHDGAAQNLIGVLHQLESICLTDEYLPEPKLNSLWSCYGRLNSTLQEIRQLSRDLRPSILDHLGFLASVDWLIDQFKSEHNVEVSLSVSGKSRRFSQEMEVTLFRIVQEALRNIGKHAEAANVDIAIDFKEEVTTVTISDNGKGFEMPSSLGELSRQGKLGVDGMMTRARLIGGRLDIESEPGKGTTLIVSIPA